MYQYEVAKRVSHYMWFDIHCVRVVSTLVFKTKQSKSEKKMYTYRQMSVECDARPILSYTDTPPNFIIVSRISAP